MLYLSVRFKDVMKYLKGRNFGGKKFWRKENLADLAEFNLADDKKYLIWREFNLADDEKYLIWREFNLADGQKFVKKAKLKEQARVIFFIYKQHDKSLT